MDSWGASLTWPTQYNHTAGRIPPTTPGVDGQTLLGLCPWLSSVPHRLLESLTWTTQPTAVLQGRDILLLYAGPKDGGALDDILTQQQDLGRRLIAVDDIQRPHEEGPNDILEDVSTQNSAARRQRASWLLWGAAPAAEHGASCNGSPSLGPLGQYVGVTHLRHGGWRQTSVEEQLDTDKDSLLLLRQMVITALASRARKPSEFHSFLEHPRDPIECSRAPAASRCSSIWAARAYRVGKRGQPSQNPLWSMPAWTSGPEEYNFLYGPSAPSLAGAPVQPWWTHQVTSDDLEWP